MKKILLILVLLSLFIAACTTTPEIPSGTGEKTGRVVFSITDKAAEVSSISSVKVTIDNISAHSETEGWIDVSSTQKTYDLIELKAEGKQVLLADAQLKEGSYDQVRLSISKVMITSANGEEEAKLPSGELKIIGTTDVEANTTSSVKFDFIVDESLHLTGNDKYIFAPVVQFETKENVDVDVASDNEVKVDGGNVKTNIKVGMDVSGNVGIGLKIAAGENLEIGADNVVKVKIG